MLCSPDERHALKHGECREHSLSDRRFLFEVGRLTCAPQKNNNPVQLMAGASRNMSWCPAPTSPAASGAAWGREAPAKMAYAAIRRMPSSKKAILEHPPVSYFGGKKRRRLFLTAGPPRPALSVR